MMTLRAAMLLAVLGLFATGDDASANKSTKKTHTFRGTVVHIHHKGKQHHRTITVRHHAGKGGAVTKTFEIDTTTNIHTGGNDPVGTRLHKGQHVAVRHHGHYAADIRIVQK